MDDDDVECFVSRGLGFFQRKARNAGLTMEMVERLPRQWPQSLQGVEDALYDAGFVPGSELLEMARMMWRNRPDYLRRRG